MQPDDFAQCINEWSQKPRDQKAAYYDTFVWPEVEHRFQINHPGQPSYDLLIIPVSNPYTAILHLDRYQPTTVLFIYTAHAREENRQRLYNAATERGIVYEENAQDITATDPSDVYRAVKEGYERHRGKRIAVDVTGGTKAMSVGIAMAGSFIGADSIYIESRFDQHIQDRVPGSERPGRLPDPYSVFGDIEARQAIAQYRQHDYAVAAQLFGELAERMNTAELLSLRQRYKMLAALAALYAAWDVLDFAGALTHADALLALPLHNVAELTLHVDLLQRQRAMLRALDAVARSVVGRGQDALQTLASHEAMLPLLGTLHANALRRAEQGRYDFAALFRYRCLELISQHRLATHGLLSNAPDYKGLPFPKADLSMHFQDVQRQLGRKQPRGLPDRITLFDGYMLLAALNDPLVAGYNISRIEERSKARNTSVLAHGYRLIGKAEYDAFAQVVDELIDRLFGQVLAQPRDDWESTMRFLLPF